MDNLDLGIFTIEQIYGLVAFFVGIFILNWCSRLERRDFEKMRDPKLKWKYIDPGEAESQEMRKKSLRGWVMTLAGVGCAVYGFFTILANIK